MSPNRENWASRILLLPFSAGVVLVALFFFSFQFKHYFDIIPDYPGYCRVVSTGVNSGWWAPVTFWELHQLFIIFSDVCSLLREWSGRYFEPSAGHVFSVAYWGYVMLFVGALGSLTYNAVRYRLWNGLSAICLSQFAFCGSLYIVMGSRLDFFFVAVLFAALALVHTFRKASALRKWGASILYFILLFHLVDLRHNAMLLLPLFLMVWVWGMFPRLNFIQTALIAIVAMVAVLGAKKAADHGAINKSVMNPSHVMLLSDLRMAAILRGTYEEYTYHNDRNLPMAKWVYPSAADEKRSSLEDSLIQRHRMLQASCVSELEGGIKYDVSGDFTVVLKEYVRTLHEHPKELLMARLITLDQFFFGINTPEWKQAIIGRICPVVSGKTELWSQSRQYSWASGEDFDMVRVTALVWYAASVIILFAFLWGWRRCSRMLRDGVTQNALLAVSLAVVYLLSFFVVTPTPDFRYHYPAFVLFCYGTPILLVSIIRNFRRKEEAC